LMPFRRSARRHARPRARCPRYIRYDMRRRHAICLPPRVMLCRACLPRAPEVEERRVAPPLFCRDALRDARSAPAAPALSRCRTRHAAPSAASCRLMLPFMTRFAFATIVSCFAADATCCHAAYFFFFYCYACPLLSRALRRMLSAQRAGASLPRERLRYGACCSFVSPLFRLR